MDELHVVGVDTTEDSALWDVRLSDHTIIYVLKGRHPDELSAYAYVTNRIKERGAYYGTNARKKT